MGSSLTLILTITLSSCVGTSGKNDLGTSTSTGLVTTINQGTGGALVDITSDNVSAAGYDAVAMIMTVRFKNGYTYEYYGVPGEIWNSFIAAQPDPWSLVGYPRLVQAGVPYKRIG